MQGITPDQLNAKFQEGVRAQIQELISRSKPQQPNKYLTRKEAKNILSISYPTLTDYIKKGVLKAFRIEGRVFILRSSIDEAMKPINF